MTVTPFENIDCLICHQEGYKRKTESVDGDKVVRVPDTANMATTGADLVCQDCHRPQNHRFPGKGSDIRPTDLDEVLTCASSGCHGASPHDSGVLNRHTQRVACQACHIPVYGKDAADTAANEATEIDRTWQYGSDHATSPRHPKLTKANNLLPVYRHWNGRSANMLLYDDTAFDWVTTDTYQLLNHQVSPHDDALNCGECHMNNARMDLQGEFGYKPTRANKSTCADGCHSAEKAREWSFGSLGEYKEDHKKYREEGVACAKCHGCSR